jgi:peptide/nickel transport system ATP-binding protein
LRLDSISKRFVKRLDFAEKIANRLGATVQEQVLRALGDVSLEIQPGEVLGLVGESGCGKSTLARIVAGIMPATSGTRTWRGQDIAALPPAEQRRINLAIQMVFQDPMSSLNPRMRVAEIVGEAPKVHKLVPPGEISGHVDMVLERVGLPAEAQRRYPHQFSGGQRQRIGIARALAVNPEFVICDEAVAALDVSIQAQVINLFMELRCDFGLTYLFISHDLGVVEHISDRVVIMYLGRIVEMADTETLFTRANHPYTQALLAEIPRITTEKRTFVPIKGEIPSPLNPPRGCHFHPRCPSAMARCREDGPVLKDVGGGHQSACHLNDGA